MKLHKAAARLAGWELQHIRKDQPTLETHLGQLLPKLGIDCVLDVGANQGQYGRVLRRSGYKGRIVSFEPVQETFHILKIRANKDRDWKVNHFALGSKAGESTIHVTRATILSSFRKPNAYSKEQYAQGIPIVREEKVKVRTLDDVFEESLAGLKSPRVFLKMDTQGFDLQVFAGAKRSLPRILAMQSEISIQPIYEGVPDYLEALEVYTKAGFVISGLYPVSRDKDTLALIELDCVMRRVDTPEKKRRTPKKPTRKKDG
ncbi:MAG TPA: FkbM family methyltransferase [Gammaproteobacteria bacterium]